jgi:hypothetical protein
MPESYEIDTARELVLSRAWGILSDADLYNHYFRLRVDPSFEPTFCQLVDLREVVRIDISAQAIASVASATLFKPTTRRAFVVATDVAFGLSRMFAAYTERAGGSVAVFRTCFEAELWLGLTPEVLGSSQG